jgi:hypothetical protein
LCHGEAEPFGNRKAVKRAPSATHAKQIRAAVDRLPAVVRCEPLRAGDKADIGPSALVSSAKKLSAG